MLRYATLSLMAFAVACGGSDDKTDTDDYGSGCGTGCGPAMKTDGCGDGCGGGTEMAATKTVQLEVTGMT